MNKSILRWMTWKDIRDITTVVNETPMSDTTNEEQYYMGVLRHLREMFNVLPPIEERYPIVLRAAELATSWSLTDSRDRENTLIRSFVAYRLYNDGYSYSAIGRVMVRDHSSVAHLVYRMCDMISVPDAYKWELQRFKRFEELL